MANKSAKGSAKPSPGEKPQQPPLILIVDDENGRTAEPMWNEHKHEIDLLLSDVVRPERISGRQLAERCLKRKPALKVIFTSGYNTWKFLANTHSGAKAPTSCRRLTVPTNGWTPSARL